MSESSQNLTKYGNILPCYFCGAKVTPKLLRNYSEGGGRMSKHMEFYIQDDAASIQIGKNVYRRVSIPIDDFNAACDHYGFVKERTCHDANTRFNAWTCSECKCTQLLMFDDYGEPTLSIDGVASVPNYCPNCGARVTKSDQYL